ncbi:MAG: hypothetical protein C0506_12635 [Anaerolinea sp.]|nr:hypothetical protein [Anaerolinea sp.]
MGVVAAALANTGGPVGAGERLLNPGFEQWADSRPSGWFLSPGTTTAQSTDAVVGTAAELRWAGSGARISQTVDGAEGATYAGSAHVAGLPSALATLRITFLSAGFVSLGSAAQSLTIDGPYQLLSTSGVAPPGTAYVTFAVEVGGANGETSALVDSASLDETLPPPTATPTPNPTETPTPTPELAPTAPPTGSPTSTPAAAATTATTASATATSTAPAATATRTPTATRPPTEARQPTATRTPTPQPSATATKTPTPTPPAVQSVFGGLLKNGDFEDVADGKPLAWSKFGGTMESSARAFRGKHAASLVSDTASTKWLFQVAPVVGGRWYAGTAMARVDGTGEGFIRLSWYAAADGGGTALAQHDSAVTTDSDWSLLTTGSVQAPAEARSVRFRLMLRPDGDATVSFDDALLEESLPATPTPIPAGTPTPGEPAPSVVEDPGLPAVPPLPARTSGGTAEPTVGQPPHDTAFTGLRISEVMSDPVETGRDSAFEWVELVNTADVAVELAGWAFGDARQTDLLPAATLAPGGFLVVAGKSATFAAGVAVVRPADGEIGGGLNNAGDTVRLIAPDGSEADAMSFGDDDSVFDRPPAAPDAGKTIGTGAPGADSDARGWALTERPTPGEPNVFPPARSATDGAGRGPSPSGAGDRTPPEVVVDRGEGGSPIPWILMASAAAAGGAGVGLASQRLGRKRKQ